MYCSRPLASVPVAWMCVATLGEIYSMNPATHEMNLETALHHDLTLGGAVALLIFFAFAMQCISTIAVVRRP